MMEISRFLLMTLVVFLSTFFCLYLYRKLALKFQVFAMPNYRSLHANATPRGAGLVISLTVYLVFQVLNCYGYFRLEHFQSLALVALLGVIVGYVDDVFELSALFRLLVQAVLSMTLIASFHLFPFLPSWTLFSNFIALFILLVFMVWFFNLCNFIDGIDLFAGSAYIFICCVVSLCLFVTGAESSALFVFLTSVPVMAFLLFNWPPAKLFLGDSGSFFIAFMLLFLILYTYIHQLVPAWVWLVGVCYYVTDTTLTTTIRLLTGKKLLDAHRSHAYQNLARVFDNHLIVLRIVMGYNLLWLFPLVLLGLYNCLPTYLILILAYLPAICFVLKFGPLYQDR